MAGSELTRRWAEDFVVEADLIQAAREVALELGLTPPSPAVGAQLAVLAAALDAAAVIEVGTGTGVAALWVLQGAPDAQITSIDAEPEHHRLAREALALAPKARLITGRPLEVLPRMNDASYDLVLLHADGADVLDHLEHGLRIVRQGGAIAITGVLRGGRVADATARDEQTVLLRDLLDGLRDADGLVVSLSTAGDGMLQIVRR